MAGGSQPEAGSPRLPTHELTWEELESFLDGLLERLQRLPGAKPRLAPSYRYGRLRRSCHQPGILAARDSKDPEGAVLVVGVPQWPAFLVRVHRGSFITEMR